MLVQSPTLSRRPSTSVPARLVRRIVIFGMVCLLALAGRSASGSEYYVDSIAGNDGADGLSPETAFATLAKVRALVTNGTTVRLRRGSLFRDHLSLGSAPLFGVTINAYGDGPRPIIDGGDLVPTTAWAPADAATSPGVYQVDFTPGPFAPIDIIQVVENDYRLPRLLSLAECAAQPGSSFDALLPGGTYRVYVHPTTSSLEGRSLVLARRDCIRIWGHNHRVDDLHLRNAVTGTGSLGIFEGDNFEANNLLLENGTRHHMVISNGTFRNCTFYNLQSPTAFPSVYSLFRNEISGAWIEMYDCTFVQDLRFAVAAEIAVAHGSATSTGAPSHALHRGCRIYNFAGPGGVAATGYFSFEECLLANVRDGFRSPRVRFIDSAWLGDRLDYSADFFLSNNAHDLDLQVSNSFIDTYRFFQSPVAATARIEVRDTEILCRAGVKVNGTSVPATFIFERNVLDADWFLDVTNLLIPAAVAWSVQHNKFYGGLPFNRGSPSQLYPNGDYLYTEGGHYRFSQWLLDRGQAGNSFLLQSSRRNPDLSQQLPLQLACSDRQTEISLPTQLGASYQLATSPDLQAWTPLGAPRPGSGRELLWIVPNNGGQSAFFRSSVTIP